jgi:hypothetical protein
MITKENIQSTWNYIREDHDSWPLRFWFEVVAWVLSIACSVIMMLTVPEPPFVLLYLMWIAGCGVYTWAAWTRGSFGMLANYLLLTTIDTLALLRILFS